MRPRLHVLTTGLAALLLAISVHPSLAAPPRTGVQGQSLLYVPFVGVEIEPGLWIGDGGFTVPIASSFTIFSAHSNRKIGHFATDAGGSFEVSLPPGKYLLVPDTSLFLAPQSSLEFTVTVKCYTQVTIFYDSVPITLTPFPQ
jgi:hypothetical protein